jgi:hypothetical protein
VGFLKLETILIRKIEEIRIGKQKRGAKLLKRNLDGNQEYSFFYKITLKRQEVKHPYIVKKVT